MFLPPNNIHIPPSITHPPIPQHVPHPTLTVDPLTPIQTLWQSFRTPNISHHPQEQQAEHPTDNDIANRNLLQQAQRQWTSLFQQRRTHPTPVTNGNRPMLLTPENQRTNTHWGDILQEKRSDHTRIYVMNVNGFNLDRRGGQFDTACEVHKEVQADIMCGQEHNLDTNQTQVRSILYSSCRQHWHRSRVIFGTTPIPFSNHYKPGGTFIVSAGDVCGRITHQETDKWGRWVSQTLQGRAGISITVISAYQVVAKTNDFGSITAASQQHSLLYQTNDTVTNPRTAFRRDLTQFLLQCKTKGHEILLVGDFNEPFGKDPDGMPKIASEFQLVDLMTVRHSSQPPATYARGRTRLDYALATQHVATALKKSGYEPFNARFHTDHRAYFFDFNTLALLGTHTQSLSKPADRILKTSNIPQVTQYIKKKYDLLMAHNVFERIHALALPGNHDACAERLDNDILAASLAAEKQMQRFGSPAWSQELAEARRRVSFLSKCMSMTKTGLNHDDQLHRYLASPSYFEGSEYQIPTTLQDCTTQLRQAKQEVQCIVKTSFARRDAERNQKIQDLEQSLLSTDHTTAKRLRRLRKAEDVKQLFSKLKSLRNPGTRIGITRIEIPIEEDDDPKTCIRWRQIEVPTEVLYHLQKRNREHFGQAHGTPFTVPPLLNDLGFCGDGSESSAILNGTYDTSPLDSNVALLVQHLQRTAEMEALDTQPTITPEEYTSKLKIWTESTSTSPSGLHLGHYKSLISRHQYSNIDTEDEDLLEKRTEWNRMQEQLLDLHVRMLNYALERGYTYRRWQTVANAILFKDKDNVRIHRTRVIHIYEADYNLTLGIKWRTALYKAESLRELNDGQYGSRPRRNALDPVLIEELQFEISRASRKMLVQTNYDATSCYDRIIPNLAMMVSKKFGVHELTTLSNARTLQNAEYRIRTELGVAESGYKHSDESPIYGTGQGSGNSPMIWCFLSSILFDCYEELSYAAQYCHPDRTEPMSISMIGFVDDSNGQTNRFFDDETDATLPTIIHQMRSNAQVWSNILGASGGALELSKCSSHVLTWQFSKQGDPVLVSNPELINQPVSVQDPHTHEAHDLTFLSPYSAHKTLGHYKEPAGNQQTQFRKLREQSDEITAFLWKCQMTPLETWTYYYACYLPSVGYPLASSSLTYKQLDRVQRKAMQIIYAKCGYNRHTKREILYGPLDLGGANFRHLYMQQGIGQVTAFVRHWRQQSVTGKLLKCAMAWTQLTAGTSQSILIDVHTTLPHLESKWLASLRVYLASIDATIEVDDPGIPAPQREHDSYMMDHVVASNQFTKAQIRRINYCRQYLQAVTISDITIANGSQLDMSKYTGNISLYSSITQGIRVHQDQPSSAEWLLWKKANLLWSDDQGNLIQPLGKWVIPITSQRNTHFAYKFGSRIAIRHDLQYHVFKRRRRKYAFTGVTINASELPMDASPVDAEYYHRDDSWFPHPNASGSYVVPPPPPAVCDTFEHYIQTLDAWEIDLLQHLNIVIDPYSIRDAMAQGFCAVSDGSVRYQTQGSFGWVLSTPHGERAATCMGPSRAPSPTSFRAEGSALLSFLVFLRRIAEYTSMPNTWQGTIGTDSSSLLHTLTGIDLTQQPHQISKPMRVAGKDIVLDVMRPDWDVLIEIQYALAHLPDIHLKYVRGHQDKTVRVARLPLFAQLNVEADAMASLYQDTYGSNRPIVMLSPRTRAHLVSRNGTITARYPAALRNESTGPPLRAYIQARNAWDDTTMQSINWDSHGQALRNHISLRLHFSKVVHDILPTFSILNKQDKGNRTCPCCPHTKEDRDHIIRCPHPSRNKWRHSLLTAVHDSCTLQFTSVPLKDLLQDALRAWMYHPQDPDGQVFTMTTNPYPRSLHLLIRQQNQIGWRQLFHGRFSGEWSRIQGDHYYITRDARPAGDNHKFTGEGWQLKIIMLLWQHWRILWGQRNNDVHGHDTASAALADTKEVTRQLHRIYAERHNMEPSAQSLLCEDIRQHLTQPTWVVKNWITIHAPVFHASIKRARKNATRGVRSIRTYFGSG